MSGSLATLYDPETGLARNRNDPRYAMAQKLLEDKQPTAINSAGATWASALGGIARAYAAQKLMGDAKADGQAAGERQQQDATDRLGALGLTPDGMAVPSPKVSAAPAPAPVQDAPAPVPAAPGAPSMDRQKFIETVMPFAQREAERTRSPVEAIIGHWGQETGWGQSLHDNNLGNITAGSSWQGRTATRGDKTADGKPYQTAFRAYDSLDAAAKDYGDLLTTSPGYKGALGAPDALTFGKGLAAGKYFANPNGANDIARAAGMVRLPAATPPGATPPAPPPADGAVPAATPMAQPLSGPAMAAKLDPSIAGVGGAVKPDQAPGQPRLSPEQKQAAALSFASSSNPLLQRMAPILQAQAQQEVALRERNMSAADRAAEQRRRDQERREDRDFAQRQAEDARRERQQMSIEARVPPGYQWNADKTQLVAIPGGPVPTRQEATAQAERDRQARLNQTLDEKVPPGYRWNADHTAQEKVPGGPADKPEKPPSDGVTKGIMGNMSSLRQLDAAIDAVGKNGQAFGMDQAIPFVSRFGPQSSIDARAQVSNIGSLKLHERSGAAVTASEYPRLAPFIPSASDPPDTVKTKLEGMRRIMQDQLRDQYDTYGPGNGYKPVPGHAAALGLDDAGNPTPAPAAPTLPGGAAVRPTSATVPGPAPAAAQPQAKARGVQAIEAARAKLGPNASDDDVVNEARKMLYGG